MSDELGEHAGLPQNAYRWRVATARLRRARGDLDARARPARRGRAALQHRLLPARPSGRRAPGAGAAGARRPRRGAPLGGRPRPHRRRRAQLRPRVRAHHPRPRAPRSARHRARRRLAREGDRAAAPAARGGRGRRPDGQRHRDPRRCWRSPTSARGDVAGRSAPRWSEALDRAEPEGYVRVFLDAGPTVATLLRDRRGQHRAATTPDGCWPPWTRRRPRSASSARARRRAERPGARCAPPAAQRPERARHRP